MITPVSARHFACAPATRPSRNRDYAELSLTVQTAGLLRRRGVRYFVLIATVATLFVGLWFAVAVTGDSRWQLLLAVGLGLASTQIAFLGHDGGHQQVFTAARNNDRFGRLTGNLLVGLSFGWWVGKHNRHHANPNKEHSDPDIGEGVLAFTSEQIARRSGGIGRFIAQRQAWLFFPLLVLEGWNLHGASLRALLPGAERSPRGGSRRIEAVLLAAHWTTYLTGVLLVMSPIRAIEFVAVHQAVFGLYMGCSFAPNHKGMPVLAPDVDLDYLRRQVLTSRNVRGNWLTDWLLGGLNYQIEHHLFPSMPRFALRQAQPLVRDFCRERGVTYTETSLIGSYRAALNHLNELGAPARAHRPPLPDRRISTPRTKRW